MLTASPQSAPPLDVGLGEGLGVGEGLGEGLGFGDALADGEGEVLGLGEGLGLARRCPWPFRLPFPDGVVDVKPAWLFAEAAILAGRATPTIPTATSVNRIQCLRG